jgi:arginine/lysine/histidine transporter system substrate-binding protein
LFGSNKGALKALGIVIVVALVSTSFLGCLGSTSGGTVDQIKARGTLIIGTEATFPPFESYNSTANKIEGFDIDIAQKIADRLGVRLEIRNLEFAVLIGSVKTKQIDMAIAGMSITPERSLAVAFSNPYYTADQAIIVRNGTTDIQNAADLAGKKIAVNLGTTGDAWVTDNLVNMGLVSDADVHRFGFAGSTILELTSGRVDAVVIDRPVADAFAAHTPGIRVVFTIVTNESYGIAMNTDATDLVALVNQVLADMVSSGEMQQLVAKWFN